MTGIEGLRIRPFVSADVDRWARTDLQRRHLVDALEKSGDYLAAVLPDGRIVGKIGIRYDEHPGAGTLLQFDVVESFRNQGIGTALIERAEQRIRDHGCDRVTLGVEETNEDAIRLYRRRGYEQFGTDTAEWDQESPDGTSYRYRCLCLLLEISLAESPGAGPGRRTKLGHDIVIRPARPGDEAGVHRCKGGTLDQVVEQVRWTVSVRTPGTLEHLVAAVSGEVVGTVMLMIKGSHASVGSDGRIELCRARIDSEVGQLGDWVVSGDHHRQGIGTALARAVVAEGRRWGLARIETSTLNPGAAAALAEIGFREYGRLRLVSPRGADRTHEMFFYLDL